MNIKGGDNMIHLDKNEMKIVDDQILGYCPTRVAINDTHKLNAEADRLQAEKGELPLFDDAAYARGEEDWYNFYLNVDEETKDIVLEYETSHDYGVIDINEETKRNAYEIICKYYGGEEEYQRTCKEYWR